MALVVICGQPCSGKSTAATSLAEALKESDTKFSVRIIDEASFHLDRNQNYVNMPAEKNLRGVLRSEVDRSVSKDSIIIVDSLNSIKGYRYELWCLARATGIRYCVVFCDVEGNQCQQWNEGRKEKDSRNRWDSPLFELHPSRDGIEKSSPAIVDAVSYLTKELDRATQEVISVIVEAQSQALGGPMNGISIGQDLPTLNVSKSVGLPELRRLRRTFMKLTGQTSLSGRPPPSDAESAKRMFVDYLNRELDTA
ncbi:Protein KTI12 homolog [Linum perenne]